MGTKAWNRCHVSWVAFASTSPVVGSLFKVGVKTLVENENTLKKIPSHFSPKDPDFFEAGQWDFSKYGPGKPTWCTSEELAWPWPMHLQFRLSAWRGSADSGEKSRSFVVNTTWVVLMCLYVDKLEIVSIYHVYLPGTPKQPFIKGCFNWMIPNLYVEKWFGNHQFHPFMIFINGWPWGFRYRSNVIFVYQIQIFRRAARSLISTKLILRPRERNPVRGGRKTWPASSLNPCHLFMSVAI